MQTTYEADMKKLDDAAEVWYYEVSDYQQSARGLVDSITTLSGDIVKSATEQLQQAANGDVKVIQEFANRWGFDRPTPGEDNVVTATDIQKSFQALKGDKE